ncbi:hypothetical protein Ais01nite_54780 [Asanoa ishikariensis]|uniref:Uncharacterized protein n=1 Tax=Asanoa ishikariensis TaxID=137265 RepID=A0A1H3TT82_9ACTN|nr:hypothetical protein [Asanoa ishikariensis]GIF67443.1 hypothetical protein Ais01nite_54780 [Asanoa ishikariensis]SDZ53382.1 hypothetical protein SAMN05421684_6339 [Asanoa ishikariensis]
MVSPNLSNNALEKRDRWAAFRGLSWWQLVLSLLPLVLIALGGLIGGAIGGAGAWLNLKLARRSLHPALKALAMIVVGVAAYVVWVVVVIALNAFIDS